MRIFTRVRVRLALLVVTSSLATEEAHGQLPAWERGACHAQDLIALKVNPTPAELRCRYGVNGPGRFGLLSYADLPVYQPATPMPGTHLIGVPGHARPTFMETFEQWEWRVLRTRFGSEVHVLHRDLDRLDPTVAVFVRQLEQMLSSEGVQFRRRETWRSPVRQAYLFQQGRSRPGPLATTTLTSWHAQLDQAGRPAGRAVDYDVPAGLLRRFHEIAEEVGLQSFGHDSHDPGHVFLPSSDLDPTELAVLRTLPRVPEVTLATGLPVDRSLPPGGRAALRERTLAFIDGPFIAMPMPAVTSSIRAIPELPHADEVVPRPKSDPLAGSAMDLGATQEVGR